MEVKIIKSALFVGSNLGNRRLVIAVNLGKIMYIKACLTLKAELDI